ncbi:hypothetical protein LINPERHAP2_LOCUS22289, partial [Linum perenne]
DEVYDEYERCRLELLELLRKEEAHWRQRAKQYWLKEGDLNSRYFHAIANGKKRRKKLTRLRRMDGSWAESDAEMGAVALTCGVELETSWHLFLTCSVARACWVAAGRWGCVEASMRGKTTFYEWLLDFITSQPCAVVQDISSILWSIWEERNSRVWSGKQATPEWRVRLGREALNDWLAVQEPVRRNENMSAAAECKKWHPPGIGSFKCNTDGAIDARGNKSGAGMAIRGSDGQLIQYRMTSWGGTWRSKDVEARALLEALSWVEAEGPTIKMAFALLILLFVATSVSCSRDVKETTTSGHDDYKMHLRHHHRVDRAHSLPFRPSTKRDHSALFHRKTDEPP